MIQQEKASAELSLKERDRRYALIRAGLKEQGVDLAIVNGSNLFYLSNGIPGELYGILTADEVPLCVIVNRRHLVDISTQVIIEAQEWVSDFRPGTDGAAAVERIKQLHLDKGTLGVAGGLSYRFYAQLQSALSAAKIVDVSDIFTNVRTVKSEEEVALINKANRVFDAAIKRVHEVARPGMLGSQVVQEGIKGMWEAGGDLDSTFSFNFGSVPAQNPILAHLCLNRRIKQGDIGTLTAHAHYSSYAGHSDQEISFGEPKPLYREMFQAVLQVREAVLRQVKAGVTQRDLLDAYQAACKETGFRSSAHSQIHQYGIDVPEFPGPAYRIADPRGQTGSLGGGGNFALKAGMIYSISPTVVARDGEDTLLGGTSLVVTEDGHLELGERRVELLVSA